MPSFIKLFPKAALQGTDQLLHPAALMILGSHLIGRIGADGYGVLSLSVMSYGFFALLCPNVASTIYSRLPQYLGANLNRTRITALILALTLSIAVSAVLTWLALVFLAQQVPEGRLLRAFANPQAAAPLLLFAVLFNIDQALSALTRMVASIERASAIDILGKLAGWATLLCTLELGGTVLTSPLAGLHVFSLFLLATSAAKLYCCRSALDMDGARAILSPHTKSDLLSSALWPWLLTLGIATFAQADQFVMSALFAGSEVALVMFLSLVGRTVHSLASASFAFLFPYLSSVNPRSAQGVLAARQALLLNPVASLCISAAVYLLAAFFLVPPAGISTSAAMLPFILANFVLSLHISSWNHLMSLGAFRLVSLTLFLAGLVNSLTVVFLSPALGANSVWLGRALAGMIMLALIARSLAQLNHAALSKAH